MIGHQPPHRLTIDERAHLLERLADDHDYLDETLTQLTVRAVTHPALSDPEMNSAWDELIDTVRQRTRYETGAITHWDVGEHCTDDDALQILCRRVDQAIIPLLHGWPHADTCQRCRAIRPPAAVRKRLRGSQLCGTCTIEVRRQRVGATS